MSSDASAYPGPYRASKCPCGHPACASWHVDSVAAVQGVSFSQRQAEAVAKLLNEMAQGNTDE